MASPIGMAILALASAVASHAGVAITQVVQELYGDHRVDTNLIRIENDKVRIDPGRDPDTFQIYRGDLAVLWTVNLKEKTYFERTGKEVEAMRAKWNEGLGKIREQMETLPPGRQKEMQDKLARMANEARTTFRKIGDGGKVGGWPTEKYQGYRKNEKIVEAWVSDAGNLPIRDSDARALRDMDGYFGKYSSGWPGKDRDKGNGPAGATVRTISFRDGKLMWRTEYVAAKEETCTAGLFEIPPGPDMSTLGPASRRISQGGCEWPRIRRSAIP